MKRENTMYNILIVEDDENISKLIKTTLSMESKKYKYKACYDGKTAKDEITAGGYDLILLDVMLPGMDGFSLMEYIQPTKIPVIFITAKQDVSDRVKGLKLGAEDYILKPFDSMELLARIEVVLRRFHDEDDIIWFGDIKIDIKKHSVTANDKNVPLTPKEFEVLVFFMRHQDVIVRKERLMSSVWGFDFMGETRTVDTHVQQVRKKLKLQKYLITVPKVGYCLNSYKG